MSDLASKCTTLCDGTHDLLAKNEIQWDGINNEGHVENEQLGNFNEEESTTNHVVMRTSPSPRSTSRFQAFLVSLPCLAAFIAPIVVLCFLVAALCARDLHVPPPRRGLKLGSPLPLPLLSTTGKQENFGNQVEGNNMLDGHRTTIIDRWGDAAAVEDGCEMSSSASQRAMDHLVVEAGKHKSLSASTLETNEMVIPTLLEWQGELRAV